MKALSLNFRHIVVLSVLSIAAVTIGASALWGSGIAQAKGKDGGAQKSTEVASDEPTGTIASDRAGHIRLGDIEGESKDDAHRGWSDIDSFGQSIERSNASTGASRRRGDVKLNDIVVTKELDSASVLIAEAALTGKVFPKVEIHLTASYGDAGRVTYYAYELTNVRVVNYSISGDSNAFPMDEFALNFEQLKTTYTEVAPDGSQKGNVEYSWKVEEGVK